MAFTGRLGTANSQLGHIELGSQGSTTQSASFTADSILLQTQAASFTADAYLFAPGSASFTVDSVLFKTQSKSLTTDAFIRYSFRADAVLRKTTSASFTANAVKFKTQSKSLTVDALLKWYHFTADAYISVGDALRHARTGPHTGVDYDSDHTISFAFDRYLRGENLREVLIDIDSRLTYHECTGGLRHLQRLAANAILYKSQSHSFTADAWLNRMMTFTANAVLGRALLADAWIRDPNHLIMDDVLAAQTWSLSTVHRAAVINSANLTHDPVNDPPWFDTDYLSGWAKFTLTGTQTVHIDTVNTQGDTYLELWTGGPGAWPSDPIDTGDDNVVDPTNPYGFSEQMEDTLAAGTYWVGVHPFDDAPSPNFNVVLRMYLL